MFFVIFILLFIERGWLRCLTPLSTKFQLYIVATSYIVIGTDCTGSCKSNYHTITTTMGPLVLFFVIMTDKTTNEKTKFGHRPLSLFTHRYLFMRENHHGINHVEVGIHACTYRPFY